MHTQRKPDKRNKTIDLSPVSLKKNLNLKELPTNYQELPAKCQRVLCFKTLCSIPDCLLNAVSLVVLWDYCNDDGTVSHQQV